MAEELHIESNATKTEKYASLLPQIKALLEGEPDEIANLANVASALWMSFGFFWVGFYFVKGDELVLGPFQGPVACTRFPATKGVCGASVQSEKTVIVSDVEQFPGHIACSADSKSEIVVPLIQNGKVHLVLDVDSDQLNDFDEVDQKYLEEILKFL